MTIDPVVLTRSGRYVNILNPDPATLNIEDIAHSLANIRRFGGHTRAPYTVAEHSIRVSLYLKARGYTPASQLAGLLHDASEAYLGDVVSPLKALLPDYKAIEDNFEKTIELWANVSFRERPEIKMADLVLLACERDALLPATPNYEWGVIAGYDPTEYDRARGGFARWGDRTHQELVGWFLTRYRALIKEVEYYAKN